MDEILSNRYLRRGFYIATSCILALLVVIRFFAFRDLHLSSTDWKHSLAGILEALVATGLTTIAVGSYIHFFPPRNDPTRSVAFVAPVDCNGYFEKAVEGSTEWHFRGGLGRGIATGVVPRLSDAASNSLSPITINAQILNPRNHDLCQKHAELRNSVKSDGKQNWTVFDVQAHLYSTIVTLAIYESNNPFLNISVSLIDYFSMERIDISSTSGIITKEDKMVPAISFSNESALYSAYRGDLDVTSKQGDIVNALSKTFRLDALTATDVADVLAELDFALICANTEMLDVIAAQASAHINPYLVTQS